MQTMDIGHSDVTLSVTLSASANTILKNYCTTWHKIYDIYIMRNTVRKKVTLSISVIT